MFEYELVKRNNKMQLIEKTEIDFYNLSCEEDDVIYMLNETYHMNELDIEHSYVVAFDNMDRILGIFQVSKINDKESNMNRRSIGMFLLLIGAKKFAVYHNHPDDIKRASDNDINTIPQLELLGNILDITFLNSFIICKNGWIDVRRNMLFEY